MADRRRSVRGNSRQVSPAGGQRGTSGRGGQKRSPTGTSSLAVGGNRIMGTPTGNLQKRQSYFNRSRLEHIQSSFRQDLNFLQGRILAIDQSSGRRHSLDIHQTNSSMSEQLLKSIIDDCSDPSTVIRRDGYSGLEEAVCTQALILQLTGVVHARMGTCADKLLDKASHAGHAGGRRSSIDPKTMWVAAYDLVNAPASFSALVNRFLDILTPDEDQLKKIKDKYKIELSEWQSKCLKQASELQSLQRELDCRITQQGELLTQEREARAELEACRTELDSLRAQMEAMKQASTTAPVSEDKESQKRLSSMNEFLMWTMQYLEDGQNYDLVKSKAEDAGGKVTITVLNAIESFRESRGRCQELAVEIQKLKNELHEKESALETINQEQQSANRLKDKIKQLQSMVDELTLQNNRLQDAQSALHSRMNSQNGRPDIMSAFKNIDNVIESEMNFLNVKVKNKVKETSSQLESIAQRHRMNSYS